MSCRDIVAICQRRLPQHPNDCSGFVRAVAGDCGVIVLGDANAIVEQLKVSAGRLADGPAASTAAQKGQLVIAGAAAPGHGHVVVVIGGPMNKGRYPYAFWGQYRGMRLNDTTINIGFTRGHGTLNWAFGAPIRDSLVYAAFQPLSTMMPKALPNEGHLIHIFR